MLGPRLNTTPPTPPAPRFWQDNAPLQSSAVTVAFQAARHAVNLGVTMALARLIAPADFGLFAMASAFTALLAMYRDGGVEAALVNRRNVTEAEAAAITTLTVGYSGTLALVCAALGPLLAYLYGEPRLVPALLLTAVAYLFYGFDVLPGAQLLRAHRFRVHAAIDTIATFAGWGVCVFLAWREAGYWALFATEPVTAVVLLGGHTWAARWRPRFHFDWKAARPFVQFGRDLTLSRTLSYGARNIDNLILGMAAGPVSLAFYNKAFRLVNLPQDGLAGPLSRIAVPLLTQLHDRPAEFIRAFRHFNLTSMALGLPAVAFLLVSTAEIVAVVYGGQWTDVAPLLRWLGVMGLCNTFLLSAMWVYLATGTLRRQIRWEAFNLAVLAAAFLLGVRWGATGVAIAASTAYAALRVPALVYCFRGTPLRLRDVGEVLWRPLLATAIGAGAVLLVRALAGVPAHALAAVARDGAVLAAGYAAGWIAVPGWRAFLRHELRRPELAS